MSSLALATHGLLTTSPPVTSLNLASLGHLDDLVAPTTVVTDVIGVTDTVGRTVAYVRVVVDEIGVTDLTVVPVEIPPTLDDVDRLLARTDVERRLRRSDVERMLDGIETYLRRVRPRLDLERQLRRADAERWIMGLDDDDIDPRL